MAVESGGGGPQLSPELRDRRQVELTGDGEPDLAAGSLGKDGHEHPERLGERRGVSLHPHPVWAEGHTSGRRGNATALGTSVRSRRLWPIATLVAPTSVPGSAGSPVESWLTA